MSALHRILVVDDDPVVAKSFNRVLSRGSYVVVSASNATEALDKLDQGEYDVVYTDIKMPGMDGLELAEKVKARRAWTPVVIITGHGSEAAEQRAKAAGVNAFMHKPLSPEMIEASAREALESVATAVAEPAPLAEPAVAEPAVEEPAADAAAALAETQVAPNPFKFTAMLVAAPFIGLAYVLLAPFAGLAALAWMAGKAFVKADGLRRTGRFLKNVALFVGAPFIGLAYVVLMPFVGLGALVWVALGRGHPKQPEGPG